MDECAWPCRSPVAGLVGTGLLTSLVRLLLCYSVTPLSAGGKGDPNEPEHVERERAGDEENEAPAENTGRTDQSRLRW